VLLDFPVKQGCRYNFDAQPLVSETHLLQIGQGKNQVIVGLTVPRETNQRPQKLAKPLISLHNSAFSLYWKVTPIRAEKENAFPGIASTQTPETLFWRHKIDSAKFFFDPAPRSAPTANSHAPRCRLYYSYGSH
jgi:hypothetical protein